MRFQYEKVNSLKIAHEKKAAESYEEVFRENRLKPQRGKHQLVNNVITGNWTATGTPKNHQKFVEQMLKDDEIIEFDF